MAINYTWYVVESMPHSARRSRISAWTRGSNQSNGGGCEPVRTVPSQLNLCVCVSDGSEMISFSQLLTHPCLSCCLREGPVTHAQPVPWITLSLSVIAVQVAFEALRKQDGKDPMLGLTFGAFLFSFFGPGLQRKRVRTLNDPRTGAEIDPNHHSAVTISLDPVQKSALACRR